VTWCCRRSRCLVVVVGARGEARGGRPTCARGVERRLGAADRDDQPIEHPWLNPVGPRHASGSDKNRGRRRPPRPSRGRAQAWASKGERRTKHGAVREVPRIRGAGVREARGWVGHHSVAIDERRTKRGRGQETQHLEGALPERSPLFQPRHVFESALHCMLPLCLTHCPSQRFPK
jgi:hypothetical protein